MGAALRTLARWLLGRRLGEYLLAPGDVARAAAAAPLCCGCSGDTCCSCGPEPCCTS
ncbi:MULTISPECIES: hypothetical protein [Streptomyces]|uniref:hypothetical protein n=1 Tax=Streptomyces TaxID=1883 RepID=UPI000AC1DFF2|nr:MULTISPECIES: hypothetical protein [Streptomyces]